MLMTLRNNNNNNMRDNAQCDWEQTDQSSTTAQLWCFGALHEIEC